jgi:hypothetical protein
VIELVVAEVDFHGHALETGFAGDGLQRLLVDLHIQRHGGVGAALVQRVDMHHVVGQHGDLVAGHVDGGQAGAAQLVQPPPGVMARPGAAMWMPTVTVPVPRPVTDSASSISVVAESSMEKACIGHGQVGWRLGACTAGKPVPLGKLSNRKRFQWNW